MPKFMKRSGVRKVGKKRIGARKGRYGKFRRGPKVLSNLNPIPARQIVKMKYSESFQTSTVGTANNYQWRLNSIYDVNNTSTGHQPYGHDQLQTLYNRYRVIGVNYVLNCYNASTGFKFGCVPANEFKIFTTTAELSENPRAQTRIQFPGSNVQTIKGYVSMPSVCGRNKQQYMADDRYQAVFGTSPQEVVALNCLALDLAEAGITANWTITLEFIVEVFDVVPLGQS